MKKSLIIALCSIAVMFTACKKPVEPEVIDYTNDYAGSYLGQFSLTITSMNNQPQTNLTFPIDNILMEITKGTEANAITASVTVENETHQTTGTTYADKADFETVHLVIDKPDQFYKFDLNLKMEGTKNGNDTLNIVGSFSGNGSASIMGQEQIFDEVSGTLSGKLLREQTPENK